MSLSLGRFLEGRVEGHHDGDVEHTEHEEPVPQHPEETVVEEDATSRSRRFHLVLWDGSIVPCQLLKLYRKRKNPHVENTLWVLFLNSIP